MKVRIVLKAKEDFGSIKKDDLLIMYNNPFDAMYGVAFYPIDRSIFALISYDNWIGIKDVNDKEIYEGDKCQTKYTSGIVEYNCETLCYILRRKNKTFVRLDVIKDQLEIINHIPELIH